MAVSDFLFVCLLSALPGPPGARIEDAYVQLVPINKQKCRDIDPIRDISYQLFTRSETVFYYSYETYLLFTFIRQQYVTDIIQRGDLRYNPLQPSQLRINDDEALSRSYFNFSEPTVIFFHAFFESSQATPATLIRTAYTQRGDHNIILVNAPRLEAGPWYLTASKNTMVVGQYTARLIDYLVSRGLHLPSLHLTGLSLGAQMAGVCGQSVRSGRIQRITGMDPAGPLFKKWPKSLKLDASDAEFVDVIHTDAGIFGYPTSVGHVDFWPNQGIAPQPGCQIPEIKKRNPDGILEKVFCSHWRSYQFYAESVVNPNAFQGAVACNNWAEYTEGVCTPEMRPTTRMGLYVDWEARGNHFLQTNPESPFSMT